MSPACSQLCNPYVKLNAGSELPIAIVGTGNAFLDDPSEHAGKGNLTYPALPHPAA